MEAANRGARDEGGRSVGCNIRLPNEQAPNPYLDRSVTCEHFFVRKVLLFKYSYAFIALPGGLGTIDELSEALTLIQTRKIQRFPVVLMGVDYWSGLRQQLDRMVAEGTIDGADLSLLFITDSVDEALDHVRALAIEQFGLTVAKPPKPSRWLAEARSSS